MRDLEDKIDDVIISYFDKPEMSPDDVEGLFYAISCVMARFVGMTTRDRKHAKDILRDWMRVTMHNADIVRSAKADIERTTFQ